MNGNKRRDEEEKLIYRLRTRGQYDEARDRLIQAVIEWPDYWWFRAELGAIMGETHHYEQAIPILESAIRLNPSNGQSHNNLGECFRQTKEFDRAIAAYSLALENGLVHEGVHYNLALTYLANGLAQKGMDHFVQALRLNPIHQSTLHDLAIIGRIFGGIESPETIADVEKIKQALERAGNPVLL